MNRRVQLLSLTLLVLLPSSFSMAQTFKPKRSAFTFKSASSGGNLVVNGNFEDTEDPLKGWYLDWDWQEGKGIEGNMQNVKFLKSEAGKRNVLKLEHHNREACVLSPLVKYEYGKTYTFTFDMKVNPGASHRLYVRGYKYKPGIRPYDLPHAGDLRLVYKGKNSSINSKSWKRVTIKFPNYSYDKMSSAAKKNLKLIRLIGLYAVIYVDGKNTPGEAIYLDNLVIK